MCDASKSDGLGQKADCKLAWSTAQVIQRYRHLVLGALALRVCEHTAGFVADADRMIRFVFAQGLAVISVTWLLTAWSDGQQVQGCKLRSGPSPGQRASI